MKERVVVGLSGGVDSSVAAHLLLERGYEVVGVFMRNWHDESVTINNECPWIDDSNDAMLAADHLGIPFHVLDLSREYRERIVEYMFREYEAGRTPNPDVLCNREIKFDVFLKAALNLNAEFVATGHYCRKETMANDNGQSIHRLLAGLDPNKDQSYFLCQLNQKQLARVLFPVGELKKPEVRQIAFEIGLPNAAKKDSQGLCFVGKVKLPVFLQQQLKPKRGRLIEVPSNAQLISSHTASGRALDDELSASCYPFAFSKQMGLDIGEHKGMHYYTIGQRKGLGVGGKAEPMFVLELDAKENIVYMGQGENHPGIFRKGLFIPESNMHWVREDLKLGIGSSGKYTSRIRYRQPLTACTITRTALGLYMVFDEQQRSIARGQFAAWYLGDELIGSGIIA